MGPPPFKKRVPRHHSPTSKNERKEVWQPLMLWLTITKCLVLVIRFQSEWDPITLQVVDIPRKYMSFSFQWRCCWLGFKRLSAKISRIPTPRIQTHKAKWMAYWNYIKIIIHRVFYDHRLILSLQIGNIPLSTIYNWATSKKLGACPYFLYIHTRYYRHLY